ncbi:DUF6115 domain-containing protein [Halalkalibacter alkalisediminis]|uniref:DUF6115 domain-containing protein n=1 Tax=Halalkalibacter alkalisediminis TaxID=935616 RepID=A0ABV6ND53_9BACI|nr:DUF6115 domain-containing protein [Halalkalibacter alkalisediminis]
MTTLLVTISLLLHGVTFLWIMTLLQKQQPVQDTDLKKVKNEIEDLLISYTAEMKEENELLLKQIQEVKHRDTKANQQASVDKGLTRNLSRNPDKINDIESKHERKVEEDYTAYQPPLLDMDEELIYEQSDSAKVMALFKQGLSTTDIAKRLKLGKGEVELMLKFHQ